MKKHSKVLSIIIVLVIGAMATLSLVACKPHEHKFGEWICNSADSVYCENRVYSRECECGEVEHKNGSQDDHNYETITVDPTCVSGGYDLKTCKICGKTETLNNTPESEHEVIYDFDSTSHWWECKNCDYLTETASHTLNDSGLCTVCEQQFTYTEGLVFELAESGDYYVVVGYEGAEQDVVIPSIYDDKHVIAIGEYALEERIDITSITIPNSVESIGEGAFSWCEGLEVIMIPDSVTSIGDYAFYGCSNLQYKVYGEIKYLGNDNNPFLALIEVNDEYLNTYEIHSDCKIIVGYAFEYCTSLESIIIPDGVESIGEYVFYGCDNLESITVSANNTAYKSIDGNLYTKDGKTLIQYAVGKANDTFIIPDGVTSIGEYAFYYCNSLTNITIGNSVTSIGEYAFYYCNSLKSVTIGNSVTSIGDCAFYACYSLESVIIGNSVTSIGDYAFEYCNSLMSITIPNRITYIGDYAFDGCNKLIEVYNKSLLNIVAGSSDYGYVGYYAKNVYTPTSGASKLSTDSNGYIIYTDGSDKILVGYAGTQTKLVLPNNITEISQYAFRDCSNLESVTIGNSVTSIGNYAFYACYSLESVIIGNSVTSIGDYAFTWCEDLEVIMIPDSVTSIGDRAFYYCDSLVFIFYNGNENEWNEIYNRYAFNNLADIFYYSENEPQGEGNYWHYDENGEVAIWLIESQGLSYELNADGESYSVIGLGECRDIILVIPELYEGLPVTNIGNYAFEDCGNLRIVTIGNSVTSIGNYAFEDCNGLKSITIGNSVTSIGEYAFYGCSSLESISIGNSVTSIEYGAFGGCSSLVSITVSANNTAYKSIDGNLYTKDGKTLIQYAVGKTDKEFIIPDGVTSIGERAFYGCRSLESITIGNSVTSIGNYALRSCYKLKSITIPNSVTSIGERAFYGCSSLESISIGNSVTSIGDMAFAGCDSLTSVSIPDSVESIGDWAFGVCGSLVSITVSENNTAYKSIDGNLYTKDGKTLIQYAVGKTDKEFIIPDGVTSIGERAFYGYYSLESITIGNSVTSIGDYAFYGCRSLESITIGSGVTSIGDSAFGYCRSLESITIGSGVTSIGEGAFADCSSLKSLTIPDSVTSIGIAAFYNCSSLESVTIGNSVTSIEEGAFADCSSLKSVTIGNSVTSIEYCAFNGCDSLDSIYYHGTESEWNDIEVDYYNDYLLSATIYYYSESEPKEEGNYWRYGKNGEVEIW